MDVEAKKGCVQSLDMHRALRTADLFVPYIVLT